MKKKSFASCWIQTQDLLARVFLSGHILSCTDVHLFSWSVDPNRLPLTSGEPSSGHLNHLMVTTKLNQSNWFWSKLFQSSGVLILQKYTSSSCDSAIKNSASVLGKEDEVSPDLTPLHLDLDLVKQTGMSLSGNHLTTMNWGLLRPT